MKNPLRNHARSATVQASSAPDTPAAPLDKGRSSVMPDPSSHRLRGHIGELSSNKIAFAWIRMQQDVDPDCARDPGSDLTADWELEAAAVGGRRVSGSSQPVSRGRSDKRSTPRAADP
jgi:hypothetical protein